MNQLRVLYDAFGRPSSLKPGWGYSVFIEHDGRHVLFDTGNNGEEFSYNVRTLDLDLAQLDFVVLSHRHGDHISGLHYVLSLKPGVKIYTPEEGAGFGTPAPHRLLELMRRKVDSLPEDMRYFNGNPPEEFVAGTPWPGANFAQIREPAEVLPDLFLFSTRSDLPRFKEMNEVSMLIRTQPGGVLIVGCAHASIEKILEAASKITPKIYSVVGGFHLDDISDAEVIRIATAFRDTWKIERVAPGHCTGQFAFAELIKAYGSKLDYAGLGAIIPLPH